jgi:glycosyltransferase involved in cell wall biosynthesis
MLIGDGPLAPALAAEVAALGVTGAVWLAGYRTNPFALLRRSHCFVYAGRAAEPRGITEARVLGLPIVRAADPQRQTGVPGGPFETPGEERVLADRLAAFLAASPGAPALDWAEHDAAALSSFYGAVGAHVSA